MPCRQSYKIASHLTSETTKRLNIQCYIMVILQKYKIFALSIGGERAFSMRDGIWRILESKDSWISPFTLHRVNTLLAQFYSTETTNYMLTCKGLR
jgi:hypothetical protein